MKQSYCFSVVVVALFVGMCPICLQAQELPQGYFRNPLGSDIALSATFAEFRTNHFHGGLDMRTGGTIGHPVYAAADGYVARVSLSPWGGGKILYIKHPNGYTSVYMHLDGYAGAIGEAVRKEQYRQQEFAISKTFAPDELPVKKGQVVAYSGNTGGSGGPHLHFEIRRAINDDQHTGAYAYNPLHAGLPYRDGIKPTIRGVRVYPSNGGTAKAVAQGGEVKVAGPFYIGIYATDAAEGSTLRNGVDRIEVSIDGALVFRYTTEVYAVDSTRVVNALIDYPHFKRTREPYLLTRALPGAEGAWIPYRKDGGVFSFEVGSRHGVCVRVYDVADNMSEYRFSVATVAGEPKSKTVEENARRVFYNQPALIMGSDYSAALPAGVLYADDWVQVSTVADSGYLSSRFTLEPTLHDIPPHRAYTLGLQATSVAPEAVGHVVMVRIDGSRQLAYATHSDGAGWYSADVRDFGSFALTADTEAPKVRPANFTNGAVPKASLIKVKLTDNLSGIQAYHCYLNGSWILAEYDGKTATLSINVKGQLRVGNNELRVEAADVAGNHTVQRYTLAWR